ncbi:DUF72 domain-containing protein [Zunongwangia endophytica]|uniref:DUF72 domain-containing protein n=1 Tax=Zunongwangia endophytica TaxID=1808945 RepID=A0ABV8HC74_9FLAO|nr:DUF72 domain-containing protein [Zunongwangia endophytica]MDN3594095.1 DUF72 domain-containing protein [Zunongwangia endophytica]
MKFGKVDDPGSVDFTLPKDHPQTKEILNKQESSKFENVRIGCAKWNRQDLKNFYPRGTKDELTFYATQFNAIELNASFYRIFPDTQFETWYGKATDDFQFSPKVPRIISHIKRLNDTERLVDDIVANMMPLKEKLGCCFLQMPDNFMPKWMERLEPFFKHWPKEIPLAVELRHTDWHNDTEVADQLNALLVKYNISSIIVDSAGRRDLLHMRLTNDTAFIRYNGANHPSDYQRLDDWLERIGEWHEQGLKELYFYVHQNLEEASPLLSAYFIEKFNKKFGTDIVIPKTLPPKK